MFRLIKNFVILAFVVLSTALAYAIYAGVIDKDSVMDWFQSLRGSTVAQPQEPPGTEQPIPDPQHFFSQLTEGIEGFQRLVNCAPTTTFAVEEGRNTQIYRWKDQDGQIHFSDQEPGELLNSEQMAIHFPDRKAYFKLELVQDTRRQTPFARDRISAEVRQIYGIMAKDLSLDHLRQVSLKVRIIETQEDFQAYRQRIAPQLNTNTGFYSSEYNEAVVFQGTNPDRMHGVIRHEATHVIVAGLYGYTPVWFNEGLAEYFEHMEVQGQMRTVSPVFRHLEILRAGQQNGALMDLRDFMQLNPQQWYQQKIDEKYALAWSLIYFLLSDEQGVLVLKETMNQLAKHYCWKFSSVEYLEQFYPGGFDTFVANWQAWLLTAPQPHRY